MLTTLGFIALLVGVVLIVCGYTVAPAALRPGWGLTILGVVLLIIGYLLPAITTHDNYSPAAQAALLTLV
jgi:uncharacterized membrane protein HdeD (DUF308 family)